MYRVQCILILLLPLLATLAGCDRSVSQSLNHGNDAFSNQDYGAALRAYRAVQEQMPDLAEPYYNAGNAYYRQERYEVAQIQYQRALLSAGGNLAEKSLFNQGNSFFNSNQMNAAIEAYKGALRLVPNDHDAKHNLELALQRLQKQQQGQEDKSDKQQDQKREQRRANQQAQLQGSGQLDKPQQNQDQPKSSLQRQLQDMSITEDYARRILESLGQESQTLQERLHRVYVVSGRPPEADW